jgi:uncharacterized protein (DUF2252 family)
MPNKAAGASQTQSGDREQRLKHGREQRKRVSRSKLGELDLRKRKFKPLDVLFGATEGRVPALLPLKYERMSASPFTFFRGAVSIMAADLASRPHSGLLVQLCGDAHVQNLGSFETPDGHLVFDINDFDETIPGPWEWDVKRMAASIVLAGSDAEHRKSSCESAVETFVTSYCSAIKVLAEEPILVAARHLIHRLTKEQAISAALKQAQRAKPLDLIKKYTEQSSGGQRRFRKIEHGLWRLRAEERRETVESLALYVQSLAPERFHLFEFFRQVDFAFKVVGTGSVGLRDYVVLMEGNGEEDPLFLQIKQEVKSTYAPYLKHVPYDHEGRRVAEGQRRIQPVSDLLLGWTRIGEHDFLVRQLNDHKGSIDLTNLRGAGLSGLAAVAGELLARGHARSGDALAIKGYIGVVDNVVKALVGYAMKYAELTNEDFAAFKRSRHY